MAFFKWELTSHTQAHNCNIKEVYYQIDRKNSYKILQKIHLYPGVYYFALIQELQSTLHLLVYLHKGHDLLGDFINVI